MVEAVPCTKFYYDDHLISMSGKERRSGREDSRKLIYLNLRESTSLYQSPSMSLNTLFHLHWSEGVKFIP